MPILMVLALLGATPIECPPAGSAARDRLKAAGEVCKDEQGLAPSTTRKHFAPRPMSEAAKAAIIATIEPKMLDARSARFIWPKQRDARLYCGFINAKNSYGGYAGYKPFAAIMSGKETHFVLLDGSASRTITELFSEDCRKAGYSLSPSEYAEP